MNMFLEIYLAGIYWDLFKTLGERSDSHMINICNALCVTLVTLMCHPQQTLNRHAQKNMSRDLVLTVIRLSVYCENTLHIITQHSLITRLYFCHYDI